jgi:hypothetical protein
MRRILILSILFGLNSCLLFWKEAAEKEETQSSLDQSLALAALSGVTCTAPVESVGIETIVPDGQGSLMFSVSGSVPTATHYLFYSRSTQSPDWTLFTSISAADFDSYGGLIYIPDPGLDDYMIRAASNGCMGPDSNTFSPQG